MADINVDYGRWFKAEEAKKDSMAKANKGVVGEKDTEYLMNGVKDSDDEETIVVNGKRMSKDEAKCFLEGCEREESALAKMLGKAMDIADRKSRGENDYPSTDMFKKERPSKEELEFLKAFLEKHKDDYPTEEDLFR